MVKAMNEGEERLWRGKKRRVGTCGDLLEIGELACAEATSPSQRP